MRVEDRELLYRSVRIPDELKFQPDGNSRLSSSAFNSRQQRPSVDRAELNRFDPLLTRKSPTDGVVGLYTSEVRNIRELVISHNRASNEPANYEIDVLADPLLSNAAHAVIAMHPAAQSDKDFKRLKERLAILAWARGWIVEPTT